MHCRLSLSGLNTAALHNDYTAFSAATCCLTHWTTASTPRTITQQFSQRTATGHMASSAMLLCASDCVELSVATVCCELSAATCCLTECLGPLRLPGTKSWLFPGSCAQSGRLLA